MHYHSFITAAKNKYQDAIAKKEKEEKEEKERLEKEKAEEEEKAAKENGRFTRLVMQHLNQSIKSPIFNLY